MYAVVWPKKLRGTVAAPPSKSCAHRLLIAASLADRPTTLTGLPLDAAGDDVNATAGALAALGARFTQDGSSLLVEPVGLAAPDAGTAGVTPVIDCRESGSTLRFMLPVAASLGRAARFIGEGRLPDRPIKPLADQLTDHGAVFVPESGCEAKLPFTVSGSLRGGLWRLPGNVTSQFVSGLLFALPTLDGDSRIELSGPLESSGYVDLTISALESFGIRVIKEGGGFSVPGGQRYRSPGLSVAVEGDWSAAAFWYGANALGAEVTIEGLSPNSWQPDRAIPALLDALILGATTLDLSGAPDLAPILAVAAVGLRKSVRLSGISRLRLKESDRVDALARGFSDVGVPVIALPDALVIPHGNGFRGGAVMTRDDHRVAMAFAIAGTVSKRSIAMTGAECVSKSYAAFWYDLENLGGSVRLMEFTPEAIAEAERMISLAGGNDSNG
ncbi:MAG: 3-phosphoshikimate 1-carboxyvinyltransferase [Oscillospiraceae bacterium]|jgi:3-phosphoshikimate 1-carboxyvinyltransferase|nr:3-phosphoshikimate 1-carboxyvinyltransferase [Oscillospiraceae bacterium]